MRLRTASQVEEERAQDAKQRAQAEVRRAEFYRLKQEKAVKTLLLGRYRQKLREITEVNATLLSANGDLMIRNEITRLQGEIEALNKQMETAGKL